MFTQFNHHNYHQLCDVLVDMDGDLKQIIRLYGYPPLWSRPNTFESLVHIILEQQVSLASALSALNKLRDKIGLIIPERVIILTDEELKTCYFSRQKTRYVRHLAESLLNGTLALPELVLMDDDLIRQKLTAIKGIGNWTVDIYLLFIVHHADVFPIGDLAAVNALKKLKQMAGATKERVLAVADAWRPYRSIATMLLWHYYLEERKRRFILSIS